VIDNHGDLGVCWRLATQLAARGQRVRLWVDDARALAWMAPGAVEGHLAGIQVLPWTRPFHAGMPPEAMAQLPRADVWIEAFGCEIAPEFIAFQRHSTLGNGQNRSTDPVWINLEYLSAEPYVERCHGLPSPVMHGPGQGLTRHFFYPGFTPRTGGLLREPDLAARQAGVRPGRLAGRARRAGWRRAPVVAVLLRTAGAGALAGPSGGRCDPHPAAGDPWTGCGGGQFHFMKIAQEIRAGNVIMHGKDPMVVLKTEYSRGGRGAATVRMKLKSLLNNFGTEVVFKADDKMDQVILDKKECTYSYFADPMYVFMDAEYNQYEVEAENMGDALNYLEDGMPSKWCSTTARPSRSNCPPASSAKSPGPSPPSRATPRARCSSPPRSPPASKCRVPLFVAQGDKIEIDTRTGEYRKRV
jgi:elongation factor P